MYARISARASESNSREFPLLQRTLQVLASKKPKTGATLYVIKDASDAAATRLCKAVKGEGMPTHKNPSGFLEF